MSQLGMPGGLQAKLVGASLSGLYAGLRSLGLDPGAEFKAGIEEAERLGARIVCGDQSQRGIAQNLAKHLQLSVSINLLPNVNFCPGWAHAISIRWHTAAYHPLLAGSPVDVQGKLRHAS